MGLANESHVLDIELPLSMLNGQVTVDDGFSSNAAVAAKPFSCFGTAGTAGTAGGCFGTIGTFGCADV